MKSIFIQMVEKLPINDLKLRGLKNNKQVFKKSVVNEP